LILPARQKKEMAAALAYQVFVVVPSAVSDALSGGASAVEALFSSANTSASGVTFAAPVRIPEEKLCVPVDTHIAQCGRHGCCDCATTHVIRPVTSDYEAFRRASQDWDQTSGVIIVKASTVAVAVSATEIADVLHAAATAADASASPSDVFYLAKWLDRPELWTTLAVLPGGAKIVRTWSPNGFQAVAFSPGGFAKVLAAFPPASNPVVCRPFSQVLNSMVAAGTLVATTTTPSLLHFDATRVQIASSATTPDAAFSYLKTCECRGDTQPERLLTRRVSADLSLFWVVVVMLTAVVSVWVLLKIGAIYAADFAPRPSRAAAAAAAAATAKK
jgi:hypothetical protein